jgi:tripartite-type tricarboxylate transporter receptor subunit TctC
VAAKSVQELIALAKANPGKLNYSSPGIGTPPHLIGELFKLRAGVDIVHVPYKGGGVASQAVVAGEVQMIFENPTTSVPLVQGGRVRGLAVTSDARNPQVPELPTMVEAGMPDFVSVSFTGVVAPAGTPAAIVDRLNAAINESLKSPEIHAVLVKLAVVTRPGSAAEFATFLAREREKWGAAIRSAGLQAK